MSHDGHLTPQQQRMERAAPHRVKVTRGESLLYGDDADIVRRLSVAAEEAQSAAVLAAVSLEETRQFLEDADPQTPEQQQWQVSIRERVAEAERIWDHASAALEVVATAQREVAKLAMEAVEANQRRAVALAG